MSWLYNRNRIIRQRSEDLLQQQANAQPGPISPINTANTPTNEEAFQQTFLLLLNDDSSTYDTVGAGLESISSPFVNPTLTIGSAVTVQAVSPFVGGGNSYRFSSSVNSYISTPGSSDWAVGTGDFTVEWFGRQSSLAQFQRVFTVGDYPTIDIGVSIESGTFYFWSGGDGDTDYSSASATVINTWYHWAVVRSGTTLSVYRNGTLRGSSISNSDNINDSSTPFIVGNTNTFATNAAFVGDITNLRFVKGLAVYTGNFTVPTSPLTATASANPYGGSNTQAISSGFTKLLLIP